MSAYWGFHCEDCTIGRGFIRNNGDTLVNYWTLRKFMDFLGITIESINIQIIDYSFLDVELNNFYNDHKDHNISLMDEYDNKKDLILSERVIDSLRLLGVNNMSILLHNYIMVFDNGKEKEENKSIYVWFESKSYFDAEEEAEQYKNCLEPMYKYRGISYTDFSLENPPYLDTNEVFIGIEQLNTALKKELNKE